jgi:hypothetical protein
MLRLALFVLFMGTALTVPRWLQARRRERKRQRLLDSPIYRLMEPASDLAPAIGPPGSDIQVPSPDFHYQSELPLPAEFWANRALVAPEMARIKRAVGPGIVGHTGRA